MCFRFALRALLLAGREPWLAFLRVRWGLVIGEKLLELDGNGRPGRACCPWRAKGFTTRSGAVPSG